MAEYFDVYNRYGEKTGGVIERGEAHRHGICHRVIHLWIINAQNQILIQQRSAQKESGGGLWYVSVGGHIESAESIESTLLRETREELGLDISGDMEAVQYLFTFKETLTENDGTYVDNEFFDVFALRANYDLSQITMQKEEVQAVKYIDYEDLEQINKT